MALLQSVGLKKEDPDMRPVACDICGVTRPLKYMKSIKWGYAMPGLMHEKLGHAPFQCPDEQHFGCTHDHAVLAMLACLFEHLDEQPHENQGKPYLHPLLLKLQQDLQTVEKDIAGIVQASQEGTPAQ